MTSRINRRDTIFLATGGALAISGCVATPTSGPAGAYSSDYFEKKPGRFPQFSIAPAEPTHGYDFTALNDLLAQYVVDFGESDRVAMSRPQPRTGSRFPSGHQSAYRNEGNRIAFSLLKPVDIERISETRRIIEALPDKAPLRDASWRDQMAYWFNLHNIAMIEQIALNYPVTKPASMQVGTALLEDAKIINVEGISLSLRDIRVDIVHRYWGHPASMYGFFRGAVGGPSIQKFAFDGSRLSRQLVSPIYEFVNSLRGVRDFGSYVGISKLYEESSLFFSDLDVELRAHLLQFADVDVAKVLNDDKPLRITQYDGTVADLAGGRRYRNTVSTSAATTFQNNADVFRGGATFFARYGISADSGKFGLSESIVRQLNEQSEKSRRLRARERFKNRGNVVIDDLPTAPA